MEIWHFWRWEDLKCIELVFAKAAPFSPTIPWQSRQKEKVELIIFPKKSSLCSVFYDIHLLPNWLLTRCVGGTSSPWHHLPSEGVPLHLHPAFKHSNLSLFARHKNRKNTIGGNEATKTKLPLQSMPSIFILRSSIQTSWQAIPNLKKTIGYIKIWQSRSIWLFLCAPQHHLPKE